MYNSKTVFSFCTICMRNWLTIILLLPIAALAQHKIHCAAVVDRGLWKLIDTAGNIICDSREPFTGDYYGYHCYANGMFLHREGNRIGFKNWKGELVVPAIFSEVRFFHNGYAAVQSSKWGMINRAGKLIVDTVYDYVSDVDEGAIVVERNEQLGIVDTNGKFVLPFYYYTDDRLFHQPAFNDGLLRVMVAKSSNYESNEQAAYKHEKPQTTDAKIGFVNRKGQLVIDTVCKLWGTLQDSHYALMEAVMSGQVCGTGMHELNASGAMREHIFYVDGDFYRFENNRCLVLKNNRFMMIDGKGDSIYTVTQPCRKALNTKGYLIAGYRSRFGSRGIETIIVDNVKSTLGLGVYDPNGKVVLPFEYPNISPLNDGYFKVQTVDGYIYNKEAQSPREVTRFADTKGKFMKYTFDIADDFSGGFARVEIYKKHNGYGHINTKGKFISLDKDKIWLIGTGNKHYQMMELEKKWGFADEDFYWLIPPAYEEETPFADNYAAVRQNGYWGYINQKGKIVIPAKFEKAGPFEVIEVQ